jgi:rubrerythrin
MVSWEGSMKKAATVLLFMAGLLIYAGCKAQQAEPQTVANLKTAITGETTASATYAAFAIKAKEENLAPIAVLFDAASRAEKIHANNHARALAKLGKKMDAINPSVTVKSTRENLETAIKGENYEVVSMYPDFIKKATDENVAEVLTTFKYAFEVEKIHYKLYTAALASLDKKKVAGMPVLYAVCPICGNTMSGNMPAVCGICGAPQHTFIIVK